MKKSLSITLLLVFVLAFAASAQAVNITHGTTANSIFNMSGISQVKDWATINSTIQSRELFDVFMFGKEADMTNVLGKMSGNSFTPFNYQILGYDSVTGLYKYNANIAQNVIISEVAVKSTGFGYQDTFYKLSDSSKYQTNSYNTPVAASGPVGFQMFMVTADQVTFNGTVFGKGSILIGFEDGRFSHIDHNDLVFGFKSKTPVVPIPASAILLAPGIAGLGVLRRKLKK